MSRFDLPKVVYEANWSAGDVGKIYRNAAESADRKRQILLAEAEHLRSEINSREIALELVLDRVSDLNILANFSRSEADRIDPQPEKAPQCP